MVKLGLDDESWYSAESAKGPLVPELVLPHHRTAEVALIWVLCSTEQDKIRNLALGLGEVFPVSPWHCVPATRNNLSCSKVTYEVCVVADSRSVACLKSDCTDRCIVVPFHNGVVRNVHGNKCSALNIVLSQKQLIERSQAWQVFSNLS